MRRLETIREILMERDQMTEREADEAIEWARYEVEKGADPAEVLEDEFGLEPDYVFDLMEGAK
jgi:methanogenic corrinoid protein MtbC1